jgi:hypothetical protein
MKYRWKAAGWAVFLLYFLSLFFQCIPLTVADPDVTINRVFHCLQDDAHLTKSEFVYSTARNATTGTPTDSAYQIYLGQSFYLAAYTVHRSAIYFDTSVIPTGATINSANLSIMLSSDFSDTDYNITIQNGQPTYPHRPAVAADYYYARYSGDGGSLNTSGLSVDTYYNITLSQLSWISLTGDTKLMLRSSNDINNIAPTGWELVYLWSADKGESHAPRLYVEYTTEAVYTYYFFGSYYEDGSDAGNTTVTFYRPTQPLLEFNINQTVSPYNVTCEADTRMVFEFDLGYNYSRIYYVYETVENIYLFRPSDPFYVYYFDIVDFVGITNGYLESIIVHNGIDRVVERWRLDVLNDIPFTMSWGKAYKMRIVCDQGTYVFGTYVAGAIPEYTLVVTRLK